MDQGTVRWSITLKRRNTVKIRSTFHVLVLLMAVLTFSMPFVTFAQQAAAQGANHLVITSQLALIGY